MKKIKFYSKTNFSFTQKKDLSSWVEKAIKEEGLEVKKLSFTALSRADLFSLNKKHLSKNHNTDVLAFDYSSSLDSKIEGEVFFSVQDVKENASFFKTNVRDEFLRVMIHGVLHLLGYQDDSAKKKQIIRKKEDKYVALYLLLFHVKPFKHV